MNAKRLLLLLLLTANTVMVGAQKYEWKQATAAGYTYNYVTNDPMNARFYTLKNGLTVILSPNKKEPRISVRIPVRTGSNNDPKEHTGLAHYLEHLLFKGTDKFGSLDWAKEKPLLDKIEELYEQYNSTKDEAKRKEIYKEIDQVSGEAAKYAIANEYDKMMAAIGSQNTNAHTWVEETVYEEDIPANAIDKFLTIQAERFRNPIFRIFHTELEAVYEEKNRSLDNDARKIQDALHYLIFPTHNYGQQSTIGTIEHLKNPSLKAIREYYQNFYVSHNMAIIMAGDFNPDEVIKRIDVAFASMRSYNKHTPFSAYVYKGSVEQPINGPVVKDIYGPSAETMRIAYRVGPGNSREALLAGLVGSILSNGKAGLFDLNLNKQQKLLGASASTQLYKDYGIFVLSASPKQNQKLEEIKDLLIDQINVLKKGDFDESLIKAIIANYKLEELQALENNTVRSTSLVNGFIKHKGTNWHKEVAELDELSKVTKKEIVDFANQFFTDKNYAVIYKRKGEDKNIVKVEKPPITPVETNAGRTSDFVKDITKTPIPSVQPVWLNFNKDIQKGKAGNADVLYVQNKENSLFRMHYRFNMGNFNNKYLSLALQYLQFLGTDKYSAEDISKQFYNLAASFNSTVTNEEITITIRGLQENFDKAVGLFDELINTCKADTVALEALKGRLLKSRANNKLSKQAIATALGMYALYGHSNPFNYTLTDEEIKSVKAEELVSLLHSLMNYQHTVLYYGPQSFNDFTTNIRQYQPTGSWTVIPAAVNFKRVGQKSNQVLFADYDAVQAEVYWIKNLENYNANKESVVNLFNNYFGGGMGSVVFQTIRESKALAYSTFAFVQTPIKKEDPYSFIAYVGTQADKFNEAVNGMNELLNDLPKAEQNFINARKSLIKDLETERITKDAILLTYLQAQKKGQSEDIRKKLYEQYNNLKLDDLYNYHQQTLAKQPYTYAIIASEKRMNMDDLKKYGEVKKLSLTELFGY